MYQLENQIELMVPDLFKCVNTALNGIHFQKAIVDSN